MNMEKLKYYWFYPLPFVMIFISLLIVTQTLSAWDYLFWGVQAVFGTPYFDAEQFRLMQNILVNVRLPRILLTFMVGAALATAGNGLHTLFRNPLVDSYVLGISSGAAFGAALALSLSWLSPNLSAFVFGVCAVALTYLFAHQKHESQTSLVMVILSGMIVSGLFLVGLTVIQYLSDPFKLQAIVQWTMGNLHQASWQRFNTPCYQSVLVLPDCLRCVGA